MEVVARCAGREWRRLAEDSAAWEAWEAANGARLSLLELGVRTDLSELSDSTRTQTLKQKSCPNCEFGEP